MMMIPVEVRKSEIHGSGIFALQSIHRDQVLWQFAPGLDNNMSRYAVEYAEPRARDFIKERGYYNAKHAHWVVCCDEAQFWNFPNRGEDPNCILGGEQDGEHMILAARDIVPGEELTITPESDGDYQRKMDESGR
jgi:SET domain-containing protein